MGCGGRCRRTRSRRSRGGAVGVGICPGFGGGRRSWRRWSGWRLGIGLRRGWGRGRKLRLDLLGPGGVDQLIAWVKQLGWAGTFTYCFTWMARIFAIYRQYRIADTVIMRESYEKVNGLIE